ncbi:MAG: hypothetical protein U0401_08670 [Anaerolineae bacterium]
MKAYLAQLIDQASVAPFATDLLEADQALWGGFWQGDVIAPGYTLPAVELALLRATRLDYAWPEGTSVAEFLADLHAAIRQPQAGVWTLQAAGEPCVVFAGPFNVQPAGRKQRSTLERSTFNVLTLVWYCETTGQLHAGYRAAVGSLNFPGAVELRPLDLLDPMPLKSTHPPDWLETTVEKNETIGGQPSAVGGRSLAARLDAEILWIRLCGYSTPP